MPENVSLAPSPPMGWNSYDSYGCSVREDEVRSNAEYMARHLLPFGWQYIVVDGEWADPDILTGGTRKDANLEMDEYGRLVPAAKRFPSAADGRGFKPLADYVHSLGLKFGLHIMRGIPRLAVERNLPVLGTRFRARDIANPEDTCRWCTDMYGLDHNHSGAQAYFDSIVALYAGWGVDFIKADDMSAPFHAEDIAALAGAIRNSWRPIMLSLSPGDSQDQQPPAAERVQHLYRHCQMWRISGDVWDLWQDVENQFALGKIWAPYSGPGHWPDADMLPLGRIGIRAPVGADRRSRLTLDEQVSLMTLWCISRSPLFFGGDLPSNDQFALGLLTNPEVLAVNQRAISSRELLRQGKVIVWLAELPEDGLALAAFNLDDKRQQAVRVDLESTGGARKLAPFEGLQARDLWDRQDLGMVGKEFRQQLRPHAAVLVKLSKAERESVQARGF